MTDEMKFAIEVGMRVMVKVAAREIPATVIEVGDAYFLVRSETSGKEFRTSRVVDILDQPDAADIAEEAEAIREEQDAAEELRRREENEINPPPFTMSGTDVNGEAAEADEDNQNKENDTMQEEMNEEAVAVNTQDAIEVEDKPIVEEETANAVNAPAEETADVQPPAEPSVDTESAEQPAEEAESAPAEQPAEKPKKNLSLVDAAVEVLKAEKRPMNVKEMVKLAVERGLWIPTKCKTPEQSLYGGLYLDMKNSATPRVKKSAEKGKFELASLA